MINRRQVIVAGAATVAAAALPAAVVVEATVPTAPGIEPVAYVVGTSGEYNADCVYANSKLEAILDWVEEQCGERECEQGGQPGLKEDCDCEACEKFASADWVQRVPHWDHFQHHPTPADWFRANMGFVCARCGTESHPEQGAAIVDLTEEIKARDKMFMGVATGETVICEDCHDDWKRQYGPPESDDDTDDD